MEEKDFEELQQQKTADMPKSASYDNFQNITKKNLDMEFSELVDHFKVWRDGEHSSVLGLWAPARFRYLAQCHQLLLLHSTVNLFLD